MPASRVVLRKMREAYAETVIELAREDPRLLFISSDCGLQEREFLKQEGKGRLVETGIAEATAAAVAAGLAAEGFRPHLLNFAYLLGRMYNQISQSICEDAYPVKLAAYYAGVWGIGGRSHNCVTDLSVMRALPNLSIFAPADAWETRTAVREAHRRPGPAYLRLSGVPTPVVYDRAPPFAPVRILRDGPRCTIFCHGTMVHEALTACEAGGLEATVANVVQIKPLPEAEILAAARRAPRVIVVEEHSLIGGLGEAIAAVLAHQAPMPCLRLAVPDLFPSSALMETPDLYGRYGISARHILEAATTPLPRPRLAGMATPVEAPVS